MRFKSLLFAMAFMCAPVLTNAQYQIFVWENFEQSQGVNFPASLGRGLKASPASVNIADLMGGGLPGGIGNGIASTECGRYALRFQSSEAEWLMGVVNQLGLDRARLGATGHALYQADFYVPNNGAIMPNLSVLAIAQEDIAKTDGWKFYRFGIKGNGKTLFFAYANGTETLGLVHETPSAPFLGKGPGWHRFQLIFEGQNNIICAVDGKPAGFPAIQQPTIRVLNAGIMAAAVPKLPSMCYADNLSIQWAPEESPLPVSPWVPREAATSLAGANVKPDPATWPTSTTDAWARATQGNRPLLVMFYTERAVPYQRLREIMMAEPTAATTLAGFECVRIDANQLQGGSLAKKFKVQRVPCIILLSSKGAETSRFTTDGKTTWATVAAALAAAK
ncbi:hypothetical protein BH09SUM1_BH09SUM1_19210 [soil metagenome]